MKRTIPAFISGLLWTCILFVMLFAFTVCRMETSDDSWSSLLLHGMTKETSPDDFAELMRSGLDKAIADVIIGRETDANDGIFTEQDLQWLNARRQRAAVARIIAIVLSVLCAAVFILWISRFYRTLKADPQIGTRRNRSWLFILFVLWCIADFRLALILSIAAVCWAAVNREPLLPRDDPFAHIGAGCLCAVAVFRACVALIGRLPVFGGLLPVGNARNESLLCRMITPSGIEYMERTFTNSFVMNVHLVLLACAAAVFLAGLVLPGITSRSTHSAKRKPQP